MDEEKGSDFVQSRVFCAVVFVALPRAENRGDVIGLGELADAYRCEGKWDCALAGSSVDMILENNCEMPICMFCVTFSFRWPSCCCSRCFYLARIDLHNIDFVFAFMSAT